MQVKSCIEGSLEPLNGTLEKKMADIRVCIKREDKAERIIRKEIK